MGGLIPDRVRDGRGTPEDVAKVKESYTGANLRDLLGRRGNARGKKEAAE